ncbi:MAG TPA: EAL domain-containing protein [Janthinobacterium sp.]|nr:EAL domain-containing protein [Janthinobacterium sp.]
MTASHQPGYAACLSDPAGNISSWNGECERLFGFTAKSILHTPIRHLLAPTSRQYYAERKAECAHSAETMELDILRADGSTAGATICLLPQFRDRSEDPDGLAACIVLFAMAPEPLSEAELLETTPLRALADTLPGVFYIIDPSGHFVLWNKALEEVSGIDEEELRRLPAAALFRDAEKRHVEEHIRIVFDERKEVQLEASCVGRNGKPTPYLLSGTAMSCRNKYYLCGLAIDLSSRRAQQEQMLLRERALHAASNGILITRCAGRDNPIEYVNPAFERITGYAAAEVLGRDSRFMAAPGLDENERSQLRDAINERRETNVVFRNLCKNGDLFWNDLTITPVRDEQGVATHFIGVITDVTAVKQRTAHLEHRVHHDALTGLANRDLLWDRLEQALHLAQRNKSLVATVLIDLNNFKLINDTFGHKAGDDILMAVAKRMQASVRESDTVARMSGDEFVLVLVNQPSLRYTLRMIERVRAGLSRPVAFDGNEIPVGASMGVSVFPHDGASVIELIKCADIAMYHAKGSGTSDVHFFSSDMKSATEAKRKREADIHNALDNDELFLLFQPRWSAKTGGIHSVEALLRWRHPEQGVLMPASFLPDAEESGMIVPLGHRVLELILKFQKEMNACGYAGLLVSMNASYREFSQHNYVAHLRDRLAHFALEAGNLELEFREEHLLRNPHLSREVAAKMRGLGIKLSVDDFADGMSSLSYLENFPATHLKMNSSAVHAIGTPGRQGALAKMLIDIGHNLDMAVVAKEVETSGQAEFLRLNGCDELQGSYFSDPLDQGALQRLLGTAGVS